MWELDHKEGWALKHWCFWIVVLEKTLESLLDSKEFKSVNPKGNQCWIFMGRTDAEAEGPILDLFDAKSYLIWKDPDAGKDRRQKKKGWQRMRWLDNITDSIDMSFENTPGDVAETSTRETKPHTRRVGELRFITPVGPEELTLQALSPKQRD